MQISKRRQMRTGMPGTHHMRWEFRLCEIVFKDGSMSMGSLLLCWWTRRDDDVPTFLACRYHSPVPRSPRKAHGSLPHSARPPFQARRRPFDPRLAAAAPVRVYFRRYLLVIDGVDHAVLRQPAVRIHTGVQIRNSLVEPTRGIPTRQIDCAIRVVHC
jgi:hypothetical protein